MKVIKEPEKKWKLLFSCSGCGAQLEAEETDIKAQYYEGDFREPSYTSYSVSCPCCKASHSIPESSLPKLVAIDARQRSKIRE